MSNKSLVQAQIQRARIYRFMGALLFALGILFNVGGSSFGAVPANAGFGLLTLILGVCYWRKATRINRSRSGEFRFSK